MQCLVLLHRRLSRRANPFLIKGSFFRVKVTPRFQYLYSLYSTASETPRYEVILQVNIHGNQCIMTPFGVLETSLDNPKGGLLFEDDEYMQFMENIFDGLTNDTYKVPVMFQSKIQHKKKAKAFLTKLSGEHLFHSTHMKRFDPRNL